MTITVDRPSAPVATDDTDTTPYETPLVVPAPGVLGNDSGTRIEVTANGAPTNGSVTVDADGAFVYTGHRVRRGGFFHLQEITDAAGQTASATVTITVDPPATPRRGRGTRTRPRSRPTWWWWHPGSWATTGAPASR